MEITIDTNNKSSMLEKKHFEEIKTQSIRRKKSREEKKKH
jgi:hypothetical protein